MVGPGWVHRHYWLCSVVEAEFEVTEELASRNCLHGTRTGKYFQSWKNTHLVHCEVKSANMCCNRWWWNCVESEKSSLDKFTKLANMYGVYSLWLFTEVSADTLQEIVESSIDYWTVVSRVKSGHFPEVVSSVTILSETSEHRDVPYHLYQHSADGSAVVKSDCGFLSSGSRLQCIWAGTALNHLCSVN